MNYYTRVDLPERLDALSNAQVLDLMRTLCQDAQQTRRYAMGHDSLADGIALQLDPRGVTAAYEYWPVVWTVLTAEADRRGLAYP